MARERETKYREELKSNNWGEKERRLFNDAANRMVDDHFPTIKKKSADRYACSLVHLLDHFSGKFMDQIGSKEMSAFEKKRLNQGRTGSTIRRDFACLSVIFSLCEEWEWYDKNPVIPFLRARKKKGLKESPARTRYLTHEEEEELLKHASPVVTPLIMFAIDTGLRREEQFSLTWANVNLQQREITIGADKAKSGKMRIVPIAERSLSILENMPRNLKSRFVFNNGSGRRYSPDSHSVYDLLQKAANRAELEHVQWHDLRRTCGCRLLQDKGFSMEEVRDWLGHSSVTVTERIYAFLKKDQLQKRLRVSEGEILRFRARGDN